PRLRLRDARPEDGGGAARGGRTPRDAVSDPARLLEAPARPHLRARRAGDHLQAPRLRGVARRRRRAQVRVGRRGRPPQGGRRGGQADDPRPKPATPTLPYPTAAAACGLTQIQRGGRPNRRTLAGRSGAFRASLEQNVGPTSSRFVRTDEAERRGFSTRLVV